MDFVCMASAAYLRWAEFCVEAIERVHPRSRIHLFDLSDDAALRGAFESRASVRYTHHPPGQWSWPAWIDAADFDFVWPRFGLREELKYRFRRLRLRLGARNENWMTDKVEHVKRVRHTQRLLAQKPHILQRSLEATAADLAFVDADAIVLKPLDAPFNLPFDLAVTAEEPTDVIIGPEPPQCTERPSYPYKAINTGVFFLRNSPAARPLLAAWIREMEDVRHLSVDQTALANLIHRLAPRFYEAHYRATRIDLGVGDAVSVISLPMRHYNFNKINAATTALSPETSVAHFTGGKKQEQHWHWVRRLVEDALARPA